MVTIHLVPSSGGGFIWSEMDRKGLLQPDVKVMIAPDSDIQYGFIPGERTDEQKHRWKKKNDAIVEGYMSREISNDDRLVVWHGNGSSGLLELYMSCKLIPCRICEVDYSSVFKEGERELIDPDNVAKIVECLKNLKELSNEEIIAHAAQWEKAYRKNTNSDIPNKGFRFVNRERHTIDCEAADYLDEYVLSIFKRFSKGNGLSLIELAALCCSMVSPLETISYSAFEEIIDNLMEKGVLIIKPHLSWTPKIKDLRTLWGRIRAHLPARDYWVRANTNLERLDASWIDSENPWEDFRRKAL